MTLSAIHGRRMHGLWTHDQTYYRCRYPAQYANRTGIDHPKTVSQHEGTLLPHLDR